MARKSQRKAALSVLQRSATPLPLADIARQAGAELPQRTLRRWLSEWAADGLVERSGVGRSTRYRYISPSTDDAAPAPLSFLRGLDNDMKTDLLAQIRDLWTHTSTALEGNTLTLGDTHFVLQEGLTISGKPIKDHQEVIGHARAIDLLYRSLSEPLTEDIVFDLHKAVQTEQVIDIYKPNGAWKVEPNGTRAVAADGSQVFIEYAMPHSVPVLMTEILDYVNSVSHGAVTSASAHEYYAKIHMGVVHVHPFWDGNGRIARLIANIPVLKAGLPPLTIPKEERRTYIELLAEYQIGIGQLSDETGVWPDESRLAGFNQFCETSYEATRKLVEAAYEVQSRRG